MTQYLLLKPSCSPILVVIDPRLHFGSLTFSQFQLPEHRESDPNFPAATKVIMRYGKGNTRSSYRLSKSLGRIFSKLTRVGRRSASDASERNDQRAWLQGGSSLGL